MPSSPQVEPPPPAESCDRLAWIDLEMSGLDPDRERILELAIVITDLDLEVVAELPGIAIKQEPALLDAMDEWNSRQHRKTGLYEEVLSSDIDEASAEQTALKLLREHMSPNSSPMCGSSIHQDRRFLRRYMSTLHEFFHYRNLDVSTVRSLARYWKPTLLERQKSKHTEHRALSDIHACIKELRFYRQHFFDAPGTHSAV